MNLTRLGSVYFLLIILVLIAGVPLAATRGRQFIDERAFHQTMDRSSVAEDARRSLLIHAKLTELRVNSGASRAYIYLFHNGPRLSSGKPMKMMSCAYESGALGVRCVTYSQKALIVSRYPVVFQLLSQDAQTIIFNIDEGKADGLDFTGSLPETQYVAMHLITCDGQIIGWFGLDFLDYPGRDAVNNCSGAASGQSYLLF